MPEDMASIYAWTVTKPNGKEGVIASEISAWPGKVINLQHRDRSIAWGFRPIAVAHRERTNHRVRFVRFDRAEILTELE